MGQHQTRYDYAEKPGAGKVEQTGIHKETQLLFQNEVGMKAL